MEPPRWKISPKRDWILLNQQISSRIPLPEESQEITNISALPNEVPNAQIRSQIKLSKRSKRSTSIAILFFFIDKGEYKLKRGAKRVTQGIQYPYTHCQNGNFNSPSMPNKFGENTHQLSLLISDSILNTPLRAGLA